MVNISGPPKNSIRNRPITAELKALLVKAAEAVGVDEIRITSGGQPGTDGRRTGSTRHDGGRAADIQLFIGGKAQTFSDADGGPIFAGFVEAAAAAGATGIGAGEDYMGNKTIHVGFGLNENDHSRLVWGAEGRSANAPPWLSAAANAGWRSLTGVTSGMARTEAPTPGRFTVASRTGLNLRKGPGLDFGVTQILPTGAEVSVIAFDGPNRTWARVDLEGDGLVDGHLFAAFLKPVAGNLASGTEGVEEP